MMRNFKKSLKFNGNFRFECILCSVLRSVAQIFQTTKLNVFRKKVITVPLKQCFFQKYLG